MRRTGARYWLVGQLGSGLMTSILRTCRFRIVAPDPQVEGPTIYVLWHGRLLCLAYLHRGQNVMSLISRSADGEYLSRVVEHWDYHSARGSSTRGGMEALRELVRAVRSGRSLAITPDGPRGPRQVMKPGVVVVAQLTGQPLVPVSVSASSAWYIKSWDRFMIPRPFATLTVRYGDPIYVPRAATEADVNEITQRVETVLNTLTEQCDDDARH
jgi:lysophospholipid acyltransferase (LPLAT)-like uncharacterized protein